jgi:hypothetical protein
MALDFYFLRDFLGITIKYLLSSVVDDEELQGADVADGLVVGAGLPLGGGELQLLHRNPRRLGRLPPQVSHRFRVLQNKKGAMLVRPRPMCPRPKILGCCIPWKKCPLTILPLTEPSHPKIQI